MKTYIKIGILQFLICVGLIYGTTVTKWQGFVQGIAIELEIYANTHGGNMPPNWDELEPLLRSGLGTAKEDLEHPLSHYFSYFPVSPPTWRQSGMIADGTLVAMTSFVIEEDRRPSKGRYIVYRHADGRFAINWADEDKIQAAFAGAGIILPAATLFKEKPLLIASYVYSDAFLAVATLAVLGIGWRLLRRR
jgi:hypothetical protein